MTLPALPEGLPASLRRELEELWVRGTPANTVRAYATDMAYVAAWKRAALGEGLAWPEAEAVALRFLLDHARDLTDAPEGDPARAAAAALVAAGLRRALGRPSVATLDRRIASWRAMHRMRGAGSPFEAPLVREARAKARRAMAARPARKSANPVLRDTLERLMAACEADAAAPLRGLRDRALLATAWASGGRRRSELSAMMRADVDLSDLDARGVVWIALLETKTTGRGETPRLVLRGRAARALAAWIDGAGIADGPLFRAVSKADRPLPRRLSPDGVRLVLRRRLADAGLDPGFASPHGLRSGFLTQAALDGVPLQAAMRLSLHRSAAQAQAYYDDVDLAENLAADLLDRGAAE